jgi:hypothetical protein
VNSPFRVWCDDVSLAEARRKAGECRRLRLEGIDAIEARKSARRTAEQKAVTFRQAFNTFFATKRKTLSDSKHAEQWRQRAPCPRSATLLP